MLFSLEVLQAKHGDCLLLHFGKKTDPKLMVIDGGPSGVYESYLKPRLLEIKENRSPDKKLQINMVMTSHLDDDHANGLCVLTDEMVDEESQHPFKISHIWINTFDDIIGNDQLAALFAVSASSTAASISSIGLPGLNKLPADELAVIASTSQGRQIRDNAKVLSIPVNKPFKKMPKSKAVLVRGNSPQSNVPFSGLTIKVVSPDQTRLEILQKKWDTDLKEYKKKGDKSILTAAIASMDSSPFNLSSITCLVELGGKTILLTGDGRSDFILEGLQKNKLLKQNKKLHVNILKMPHHGSIRNMSKEFLERVTADHYIISADGKHENPDKALLDLLAKHVTKGTLYFTNKSGKKELGKKLDAFMKKLNKINSKVKVIFPESTAASMLIELGDTIDF
jgi:hypothetical protein